MGDLLLTAPSALLDRAGASVVALAGAEKPLLSAVKAALTMYRRLRVPRSRNWPKNLRPISPISGCWRRTLSGTQRCVRGAVRSRVQEDLADIGATLDFIISPSMQVEEARERQDWQFETPSGPYVIESAR